MALTVHRNTARRLGRAELDAWRTVPVAIVGDELNRAQMMRAAIKPVAPNMGFVAQAVTVRCMVGDNLALHHALAQSFPGCCIVADARGHEETAVWGGLMHLAARQQEVAAVIVDGAMRDVAELRASGLPAYCRAIVPAGPHKGFGGEVNGAIQCGGANVRPGDLVIGDDDGVIVVALDQLDGLLERCQARMRNEDAIVANIKAGKTTIELLGLPLADSEAE
jgi:regulator of RNase E activity RraA